MDFHNWLIEDLKRLPADREELNQIQNQLELNYKQRSVADRDRLLFQLDEREREIIERIIVIGERFAVVSSDMGLSVREIHAVKDEAVEKLLRLRFGAGYRP